MDLTQIRYFLALADTLNFTRAAELCNVTQPALTKSIQKLEDELGGRLLLRERAHSQLTELGRTMVPLLRHTFAAASAARDGAAQFHKQDTVRLSLGVGGWVPPGSLGPLLADLGPRFPTLELTVRQGGTADLNDCLLAGTVDVVLTADAAGLTERANSWPLFDEAVLVVLPAGHALDLPGPLPEAALQCYGVVSRADADGPAPAPARHLVATAEHVWPLVAAGLGLALSTAGWAAPAGLVRRPLDPPRRLQVRIAAMPGRGLPQAADALVRLARARAWT